MVWDHFTRISKGDPTKPRVACNYCGASYACDTKINGTKSMKHHIEKQCKKGPFKNTDKSQTTLGWKMEGGSGGGRLVPISFSVEACRQALTEMIIVDELPFRFVEGEGFRKFMLVQELQSEDSLESRSEVDRYLAEKCEDEGDNFDLLNWWKVNSVRYRVLSKVARDVLVIPVSTVASESTFSTAGRVLDPFRSSLNPMMVEALICTQNWLRSSSTPISLRTLIDEVEEFEKQIDMGELVGELAYSAEGSNEMATES
ncbi:uncharacterized protein LOC122316179 [Carya illinoinensis]|uniref:uncharacterized protein LOC122316179 n=1 Tax=Carya illinoinensis TaxID=32201 RepID=UPI001C724599|nr:uncharacterized protein LOC122316179 [Carya illinoinensis]